MIVSLPDGKDPDDFIKENGKDSFDKLLYDALPLIDFKIETLKKTFDLKTLDGKRKFIQNAVRVIKQSDSPAEQEDLLKRVRAITGITYESLQRELSGVEVVKESPVNTEAVEVKEKDLQAQRFVLSAYLFKKEYRKDINFDELYFSNPVHIKIIDYIKEQEKKGESFNAGILHEYLEDEEKGELSEILAINITDKRDVLERKYFEDCVKTLKKTKIEKEIDVLTSLCESEKDVEKLKDLTIKLKSKFDELVRIV